MARAKTREITIKESKGAFSFLRSRTEYDFSGISDLKQILSKEKARILDTIKYQQPSSIYNLAKILGRNFKIVMEDVKLLEKFGFIELVKEKTKNRTRHKPIIATEILTIHIKI